MTKVFVELDLETVRTLTHILKQGGWFDPVTKVTQLIVECGPIALVMGQSMDKIIRQYNQVLPFEEAIPTPSTTYYHEIKRELALHKVVLDITEDTPSDTEETDIEIEITDEEIKSFTR